MLIFQLAENNDRVVCIFHRNVYTFLDSAAFMLLAKLELQLEKQDFSLAYGFQSILNLHSHWSFVPECWPFWPGAHCQMLKHQLYGDCLIRTYICRVKVLIMNSWPFIVCFCFSNSFADIHTYTHFKTHITIKEEFCVYVCVCDDYIIIIITAACQRHDTVRAGKKRTKTTSFWFWDTLCLLSKVLIVLVLFPIHLLK